MEPPSTTPPSPLSRALDTIKRLRAQLDSQRNSQALAVVGVGLRFPGRIDSLDTYWQALADGRDLVRPMPAARKAPFAAEWDELPHKGGFLDDVTSFDAAFFGISPREARALDPQHRLLLEVTWEALENAALPPDRLTGARTGLYVGITGQDYRDWQVGAPDVYWATGNGHCFAAGRIAYAMGFTGPAIAVDTACSSSLVAVHLASQALRRGECDVAVAGGVNLILSPRSTRLIQETRALAPDGLCKTFDARANGFTRGEGCGIVVLKRLDHALRDGDHVHAVIRGSAVNQDGRSSGFTAPNVLAQTALIEAALADAGLAPADIGLVEAHGTGTALGDPIEMEALARALGRKNGGARLYVGSGKTNFGHLEAAAGIAGLLKAIACCARRAVPALVHYRMLNPRIDLAGTGITLPMTLVPWTPGDAGRFAGVSSFGISGTNAHMIVGPADPGEARPAQAASGFELTARTPEALRALAARFRERLAALPDDEYGGFAYTATSGRARHGVRARIAAADKITAMAALDAIARDAPSPSVTLGAGEAHLDELPRRVVVLPHYPWEREPYAPEAPAVEPAPASAAAAPYDSSRSSHATEPASSTPHVGPETSAPDAPPPALTALVALPAHSRIGAARIQVRRHVASLLGHRDANAVPEDAGFFDLGLDSLMAADLARELSLAFGLDLSIAQVFEHPTVNDLAAVIVAHLPATAVTANPAVLPTAGSNERARVAAPEAAISRPPRTTTGATHSPRVAFLFSGGGSQYFGMGRELYDAEPVFRARIDACDRILAPLLGASLTDLMMHGDDRHAIDQMRVMQPALVALELALAELWSSWGVTASAVIGHSLGEIAAAIHAGVMDLASGLTLIAHRARLMQSTARGAMLAVSAPLLRVAEWLEGTGIDIAAINGPQAVVVAGAQDAVDALTARLQAEGVTARRLVVSHASHSRMMDPILPALYAAIASFPFRAPSLPIVANLTGRLAAADEYDARYWCRHVREPVRFHDGAQALRALDIDVCLEIGPDRTLVNLVAAAGLLPAGGGLASLRRGAESRASILAAAQALHEQGQELVWSEVQAPSRANHARYELRSRVLTGRTFAFERSAGFPAYLGDHRLYGTVVAPVASHLATILSALGGGGRAVTIEDLACPRAFVLADGERYDAQIRVEDPDQDGAHAIRVQSLLEATRGPWQTHVSGRLVASPRAPAAPPDIAAFVASAGRHIAGEALYAYLRALGYTLGPSFRWIAEAWIRGQEALVRYAQPALPGEPSADEIHPGLIDACFQSIAGFLVDEQREEMGGGVPSLAIPSGAARLSFLGRPAASDELWGHVRVLEAEPLEDGRLRVEAADLHLFTRAGASLLVADEFRVRHVSRAMLEHSLRGGAEPAHEPTWVTPAKREPGAERLDPALVEPLVAGIAGAMADTGRAGERSAA